MIMSHGIGVHPIWDSDVTHGNAMHTSRGISDGDGQLFGFTIQPVQGVTPLTMKNVLYLLYPSSNITFSKLALSSFGCILTNTVANQ